MTEQPTRYPRTFSGMLSSLVVLVVLVLGVVGFQALRQSDPTDPVVPIDYRAAAAVRRGAASFTLAAPPSLPAGWIATSATFTPGADESWHLGLLTEDRHYVGVEQALASARRWCAPMSTSRRSRVMTSPSTGSSGSSGPTRAATSPWFTTPRR